MMRSRMHVVETLAPPSNSTIPSLTVLLQIAVFIVALPITDY